MNKIKTYLTIGCISFTASLLLLTILSELGFASPISNQEVYDMLIINFAIQIVMFFTDNIPFKTIYSSIAMQIFDVFAVVFFIGGVLLKMFPFRIDIALIVSIMSFAVYFIVFGITVIKNREDAESINKKIKAGVHKDGK